MFCRLGRHVYYILNKVSLFYKMFKWVHDLFIYLLFQMHSHFYNVLTPKVKPIQYTYLINQRT